ncbi:MAG: cadherin repeat domain-containing protein, partial [Pseudomonadota bacterium]
MADKKTGTQTDNQTQNQDPNFIYGDAPAKKKIDAWEGEGDADLVSDSGEMALANLHFGTRPEAEFLNSDPAQKETAAESSSNEASSEAVRVTVEVEENLAGASIATLSTDLQAADAETTFSVSDARFEVIDGEVRLVDGVSLDYEEAASIELTVTATDGDGVSTTENFIIDVIDINDAPSDLSLDGSTVAENAPGAVIGTLSSFDPDADDSVIYTVSDDRFEVVDGTLQLVDGVSLDHEEAASIELTVTATDSGGLSIEETFT